eukprot:gene14392-16984_t
MIALGSLRGGLLLFRRAGVPLQRGYCQAQQPAQQPPLSAAAIEYKVRLAANTAKVKHGLASKDAAQLAKMMSGVSLAASFLTDEERIAAQIRCSNTNPAILYAEAMQVGEVRGFLVNADDDAHNPHVRYGQQPPAPDGVFQLSKILYGQQKPVESIVYMQDYSITSEFQLFYDLSEQVPTAVHLENEVGADGTIAFNGGLVVQSLPGTPDSMIEDMKKTLSTLSIQTLLIKEKKSLQDILHLIAPHKIEIITSTFVDFFCRCSLKNFKTKLMTLGLEEIKHLKTHKHDSLNCNYCNKTYTLATEDFDEMINTLATPKGEDKPTTAST